jgi:hypothetical protein
MFRRTKRSKIEAVAPEEEDVSYSGVIRLSAEGRN